MDQHHVQALGTVACCDLFARMSVSSTIRHAPHTRWCVVHALCNFVVCWTSLPDLSMVVLDPWSQPLARPASLLPVTLTLWLHLYHVVFYALSYDDRVHHLLFALVLGVPSYVYARRITNTMLFFLSGLPGGLIYALVALRRLHPSMFGAYDEPRVSLYINLLCRAPGILWASICQTLHFFVGEDESARSIPVVVLFMQVSLSSCNAVFYTQQSWSRCRSRGVVKVESR